MQYACIVYVQSTALSLSLFLSSPAHIHTQQQNKLNKQSVSFPFINKYVRTNSGNCVHTKQIKHKFRRVEWKTNFK